MSLYRVCHPTPAVNRLDRGLLELDRPISRSAQARLSRLAAKAIQELHRERSSLGQGALEAESPSSVHGPAGSTDALRNAAAPSVTLLLVSPSVAMFDFGDRFVRISSWPDRFRHKSFEALRDAFEAALHQGAQPDVSGLDARSVAPHARTKLTNRATSPEATKTVKSTSCHQPIKRQFNRKEK